MKFLITKKDNLFCFHCRTNLLYGEYYVGVFYSKNYQGRFIRNRLLFHIECYRGWIDETFVRKYLEWKMGLDPPKVRGRPRKYQTTELSKEMNRKKSLARYHKKKEESCDDN